MNNKIEKPQKPSKKGLYAAVSGTIIVLLGCFTPILVAAVGIVGLAALAPYLDYVLYPLLVVMVIVTILAYRKYEQGCKTSSEEETINKSNNQ